ncbi:MAG: sugar ABC transporter permease [Thermomicrobiales bacterium]|nr:sugar ABC transporter permease [Thermomicrobiales bacterium]
MAVSANDASIQSSKPRRLFALPDRRSRVGYAFIAPALLIVVVVSLYPIAFGIWLSFTDWYLLQSLTPTFAGLAGYRRLLGDADFWQSLGRSGVWTIGTVALEYVIAMPVALLLNRRSRITSFLTGALLLPWVTPTIVVAYTWRWLFDSQFGTVHYLLQRVGLAGERSLLADPKTALWALILVSAWKGAPFMAVALLATMKSIPGDLYEAAAVDGATRRRQFLDITLPLLRQVSVVMGLVLGILAFYSFDLVWVITKGGPSDATQILGVYLFRLFFERLELSYAATIGVAMLALLIVFSAVYLRVASRQDNDA